MNLQDDNTNEDYDSSDDYDIIEEQTLLVQKFIIESLKTKIFKADTKESDSLEDQSIYNLYTTIINQGIIKPKIIKSHTYDTHDTREFLNKQYNDGIIYDKYLHSHEIDNRMYSLVSPQITRDKYEAFVDLYPCIKEPDYGSKYIRTIQIFNDCIILILPLYDDGCEKLSGFKEDIKEHENKCKILKINRQNNITESDPILTVYGYGNIMILEWNHPLNFNRDTTQLSKLVFTKFGFVTDMYWTNSLGVEYRDDLLPSHIALRSNRFDNCWYLIYNSRIKISDQDDTYENVKLTIHCCDS